MAVEYRVGQQTNQQTPEGAANAEHRDVGGSGQEGDQRGFPRPCIGHGAGEAAADGAQQRQARQRGDESCREGHEDGGQCHAEHPDEDVKGACGNAGNPALGRIFMRFPAARTSTGSRAWRMRAW